VSESAASLGVGDHVVGWLGVLATLGALALGAWRLRRALLCAWRGAPARLAETVMVLAALLVPAQLLGAVGLLDAVAVLVTSVACGAAMIATAVLVERHSPEPEPLEVAGGDVSGDETPARAVREPVGEIAVALAAVVLTGGQWIAHTMHSLSHGMREPDTLWYHAPFAVRFAQEGSFTGIDQLGIDLHRYFPFNSELTHTLGMLAFGHDVLSPALNLGWAALALLAAWCIGHRAGVGALSVTGAALVLALPAIAGMDPGQASNDVPCAALLLAAVALILQAPLAPVPTVLAAVATGLGLGMKLTGIGVVAALTVGVVVLALRARRPGVALLWCAGLAASGGFWFVRNWVVADNPLPWFSVDVGPFSLPGLASDNGVPLSDHVTSADSWRTLYVPGLAEGFGVVWPIVVGLVVAAIVVLLGRRGHPGERLVGFVVLAGAITHVFMPATGGAAFIYTLRYLSPAMLMGFAVLPLTLANAPAWLRQAVALGVLAVLALCLAFSPGDNLTVWPRGYVALGLVVALAVVVAVVAAAALAGSARAWPAGSALRVGAMAVAAAGVIGLAWPIEQHFLDRRYVAAGLESDVVNSYFRRVRDASVAVYGTATYPMFGLDLSNEVVQIEVPRDGSTDGEQCRRTLLELQDGYSYVVLTPITGIAALAAVRPSDEWFAGDPTVTEVVRDGDSVVLRLDGAPDVQRCR
jgi:hypothetical protein